MSDKLRLILAYGTEDLTLYPIGSSQHDPALAFLDAYNEALEREALAVAEFLASV